MSNFQDPDNALVFGDLFDYNVDKKKITLQNNTNELASLFREVLATMGVTPTEWETLSNRYFTFIHDKDRKAIAQDKINLARALTRNDLTWTRFLESLMVLGFDEYEVNVVLKRKHSPNKDMTFRRRIRNPLRGVK